MFLLPVAGDTGLSGVLAMRERKVAPAPAIGAVRGTTPEHASDLQFHRAMLLLRVIGRGAELRQVAARQSADLAVMSRLLSSHALEEERLRGVLRRTIPTIGGSPPHRSRGPRRLQVVRGVLERVHREFARPLSLRQLARESGMNASYLSCVFAREVGMPFKAYLTALRLQRAQELLGDPQRRVAEVAYAVGYSTPDRFRSAFRRWAGLAPTKWRDLFSVDPAAVPDDTP